MQNSRDSSVWRSLAVAFGDGLAFGVGMKVSQTAASRATAARIEPAKEPEGELLGQRFEQMERRLAQMEKAKALAPAFDQRVLEVVVNALDARLKEQAVAVDRRIAEVEAKLSEELQSLRRQDHTIAAAVETRVAGLQEYFIGQVDAIRQQVEQQRTAMHLQIAEAVKSASQAALEDGLAPVRAEAAAKDREIEELRRRAEESDAAMVDVLNGIGQVVRQAASRHAAKSKPQASVEPSEPAAVPQAETAAVAEPDASIPAFAEAAKPDRLWRVPLLSAMMVASFGVVMVHYL